MTELEPDHDADWALASAYVDGDVDAAARARVHGDPRLLDLVARLREVRAALAAPVDVPVAARASAITAALDSTHSGDASPAVAVASVGDLAAHRRRQMRWLGGAAAAVVAVVIGVGVTSRSDDDGAGVASKAAATTFGAGFGDTGSDADTEAGRAAPSQAAPEAAPSTIASGASTTAPPTTVSSGTAPHPAALVDIDSPEELLELPAAADRSATAEATTAVIATSDPNACLGSGEVLIAVITYRGTPAVATLDVQAHVRRAKAVPGCTVLVEVADPS